MKEMLTIATENQHVLMLRQKRRSVECSAIRAPKRSESCPSQVFINTKYSWQKLEYLLAANIRPGDMVGVLTYEDSALPGSRKDVRQDFAYFTRKLRAQYLARGQPLPRVIWTFEQSHGDNVHHGRRWHIHIACRAQAEDDKLIRSCWTKGIVLLTGFDYDADKWTEELNISTKILSSTGRGYEPLARYMCKEAQERLGQRTWSYSRSCVKPEIDRVIVDDDARLELPHGCLLVRSQQDSDGTEYLKYVVPYHGG